jgi:putative oxidoreductase
MPLRTDAHTVSRGEQTAADLGRLLLRLSVGGMMLLHGLAKIPTGPGGIAGMLRAHELPGILAWGVYVGEVLAPLLLIFGLWTRAAAAVVVVNMLAAIGLAHLDEIGALGETGGWAIELQALYLFGAAAIALLGAGRLSVGGLAGRWN